MCRPGFETLLQRQHCSAALPAVTTSWPRDDRIQLDKRWCDRILMASSWLSNWISKLTSSWLKWAQQQAIVGTRCDPCSAGSGLTLVMKPCPQTLWGRGRPQDMSMPGQYTAWKRRMSLPMMWFPGHPYCFRFSAVGSIPSGNRPGQRG